MDMDLVTTSQTNKLTVHQVERLVANVSTLYDATVRNGWYLPKQKSSLITSEYLEAVRQGKFYCPKYGEIKMLPCPNPPPKEMLINKVKFAAKRLKLADTGIDEKHEPDRKWLVDVLATLQPDDEIFKKNYLPPARVIKDQDYVIDN